MPIKKIARYSTCHPTSYGLNDVSTRQTKYSHLQSAREIRNALVHNDHKDPRTEVNCFDLRGYFLDAFQNPEYNVPISQKLLILRKKTYDFYRRQSNSRNG